MKKCANPLIAEYEKIHKKRIFNLSDIKLPEGITKKCVWCLGELSGRQTRWCSQGCSDQAFSWGNPQSTEGLGFLLIRQDYKCNICKFDYVPAVEAMFALPKIPYGLKEYKDIWRHTYSRWVITKLKDQMHSHDPSHRLEVDHITAIVNGGRSLSFDNLQAVCYDCHKAKTKADMKKRKEGKNGSK